MQISHEGFPRLPGETQPGPPAVQELVQGLPCLPNGQEFDGEGGIRQPRLRHRGGIRANTKPGHRARGQKRRGRFRGGHAHPAARGGLAVELEKERHMNL